MRLLHNGKVNNGKLHINNRKQFLKDLELFDGKEVTISLERRKRKRSLSQNNYYWAIIPMVRQGLIDVGYKVTIEETHTFLKAKFLVKEIVNENTGEILNTVGSTTELSTVEFMDFIAEIQQWAAEFLNVVIPDPGQQVNIEFNN